MSTGKWFQIKKETNEAVRLRDERQQRADMEAKYREACETIADLEARLASSLNDHDAFRAEAERVAHSRDEATRVLGEMGAEISAAGFVVGDYSEALASLRAMRSEYERLRDGR